MLNYQIIPAQTGFDYGIKLGISSSSFILSGIKSTGFYNPEDYYKGNSVNPALGLFIDYRINKHLSFETELSYLQKGTRLTEETTVTTSGNPDRIYKSDFTHSFDIRYLEFGVNIKPAIKLGTVQSYLILGSSLNYTLNAMNLLHNNIEKIVFAYKIGAGAELRNLLGVAVMFEIKYIRDLPDFYKYEYAKLKNHAFVLTIGFGLK